MPAPAATLAALVGLLSSAAVSPAALAADYAPPPAGAPAATEQQAAAPSSLQFPGAAPTSAPSVYATADASGLPEGTQWRYSEFIDAVQGGKVERVRFSKDGSQLQLTAVDGRRALVVSAARGLGGGGGWEGQGTVTLSAAGAGTA